MSWQTELASWNPFTGSHAASEPPKVGDKAPQTEEVNLPIDSKPTIITFLRHCGCPFAEKTFLSLRSTASKHPDIAFVAVSHSDAAATGKWLREVGGAGDDNPVKIIVDEQRKSYAAWGLGASSFWHVLNPWSLYEVYKLGKQEGIWNRPTESGTRWQSSGSFAVNKDGVVKEAFVNQSANGIPDIEGMIKSLSG